MVTESGEQRCPTCGEVATFQDVMGVFWDSNAHHWKGGNVRTKEQVARDYYIASGRANSEPTEETLRRIDETWEREHTQKEQTKPTEPISEAEASEDYAEFESKEARLLDHWYAPVVAAKAFKAGWLARARRER